MYAGTPWGAGMCVRESVADACCRCCEKSSIQLASPRGKNVLVSGEDFEICYVTYGCGSGTGIFPQLRADTSDTKGASYNGIFAQSIRGHRHFKFAARI
jgi:hypothetical protein